MTDHLIDRELDCFSADIESALPIHVVRASAWPQFLKGLPSGQAAYLTDTGYKAETGAIILIPGMTGVEGAILGIGERGSPEDFGNLAYTLPNLGPWRFVPGDYDSAKAVLGFCLGAYRYAKGPAKRASALIVPPVGTESAQQTAAAIWWARDLINTPANKLGPVELAEEAAQLAAKHHARFQLFEGEALESLYPAVAAVGAGSDRPARVAILEWAGAADGPLISLCGKGVCFDTGGYDIKPSAGMLRMKKDMGGAAIALALARLIMEARLPVILKLRIGCVENSISGRAMRPGDIIETRRGLLVEIGNTDAEGRLVLSDLLAEASDEGPDLLLDFATLTGAARVALGPDLPVLMTNDDALADAFLVASESAHDPIWRLPLWPGYDSWLKSAVADLNNVSAKAHAGAITAGLFLQHFLEPNTRWAHLDTYAWSDQTRAGHPEGGDSQGLRAAFGLIISQIPLYANKRRMVETGSDSHRCERDGFDTVAEGT